MKKLPNIHPGEVLLEEFLTPMGAIGVPPRRINEIVLGKRAITADTALRLAKTFGTSESFWMGLQADYDLEAARSGMATTLDQVQRLARIRSSPARSTRLHRSLTCSTKA